MIMQRYKTLDGELVPSPSQKTTCEEAIMFPSDTYIPCGQPANKLVFHRRDAATYHMCEGCADHNIRNRGGLEVTYES